MLKRKEPAAVASRCFPRDRTRRLFGLILAVLSVAWFGEPLDTHAGGLTYSGTLRLASGSYIDTTRTTSYYLFSGVRYTAGRLQLGASTALILQNTDLVANSGAGMIPFNRQHGDSQRRHSQSPGGGSHDSPMMKPLIDGTGTRQMTAGLGDLFFNADYTVHAGGSNRPIITLTTQIKLPIANASSGFGTGETDGRAGVVISHPIRTSLIMADLGYLFLGDPPTVDFRNAMSYGFGYGQSFRGGRYTLAVFYSGTTRIVDGYPPPRELSLGMNYRASSQTIMNVSFSFGLSETTPDVGFSIGTTLTLVP
ncbi:MAG: hypothetical protein HY710_08130 [Candidatus Latescibacteria bacterium]|nr:hypothetical protein [Candidatus Latescibacterota bacterium]